MKKRVIIMGAAGRDFHDFNTNFRNNEEYEVIAFTAAQIPGIENRKYPKELAGNLYPNGIPIYPEKELSKLIKENNVDYVFFSYSDLSHEEVMHKASIVISNGANFCLLGKNVMLKSKVPVIAVCAVRTGCGKSQTSRKVLDYFKSRNKKVVVVRHPMPYGELIKQACQRLTSYEDLEKNKCTIEEREEYEPHIERGAVVYAGVDYEKILREAEKEADFIIWDGGNNDISFFKPDLYITVMDPHRAGHELKYYPGEVNFRKADVLVINKINTASEEDIKILKENIKKINSNAVVIEANSKLTTEDHIKIKGKKVLVIEDGPTVTHGGMEFGAATVVSKENNCKIIDAKKFAVGSIKETYEKYPHLKNILPAMGYNEKQIKELEETINNSDCELVLIGTPINLGKLIKINKPYVRVRYELDEINIKLSEILSKKF